MMVKDLLTLTITCTLNLDSFLPGKTRASLIIVKRKKNYFSRNSDTIAGLDGTVSTVPLH